MKCSVDLLLKEAIEKASRKTKHRLRFSLKVSTAKGPLSLNDLELKKIA